MQPQPGFLICWKIMMNHYGMTVRITVNYRSLHRCSPSSRIMGWVRSVMTELSNGRYILPERNRLKENFYAAKSMMKPLDLGYQKIDMCSNFCMLYYFENVELTECITCGHSRYKPKTNMGKTLMAYKKLRYFSITPRLQRLFMSPKTVEHMTWH